jgi:DNA-binding PadR family transcriptional regulator
MPERITKPTLKVLELFLKEPRRAWYGLELMERADLRSGTVYPILHRLKTDGWLDVEVEDVDPAVEGRPARRLYSLTGAGEVGAQKELDRRAQSSRSTPQVPRLRGAIA